ncbi:hypothetical protein HJG60_008203 [Phyllostomus discolor]|uniref:Uncharacterized protein n=1 Tax=Phyllostomus discolor TaxID=89673 RepID=A0A834DP93_9CHIR|nr:hypothetical protein HJG60_008203 [Phyllostomus discolor]
MEKGTAPFELLFCICFCDNLPQPVSSPPKLGPLNPWLLLPILYSLPQPSCSIVPRIPTASSRESRFQNHTPVEPLGSPEPPALYFHCKEEVEARRGPGTCPGSHEDNGRVRLFLEPRCSWVCLNFSGNRREQDTGYPEYQALLCPQYLHPQETSVPIPRTDFHLSSLELIPPTDCAPRASAGTTHSSYLHALTYHVPCNRHPG